MPNISKRLKFMAWFKFGKSSDSAAISDAPVETAESLRSRAKRRLIGALVLVLTAVIGFPLLFDTQPRPVLVDVPIEIPDKAKAKPLAPPPATAPSPTPSQPAPAAQVDEKASLQAKEEIVPPGPAISKPNPPPAQSNPAVNATKSVAIASPVPDPAEKLAKEKAAAEKIARDKAAGDKAAAEKAESAKAASEKAESAKAASEKAAAAKAQEAARAKALLEGKPADVPSAAASGERFIVQFGSFAEEGKAREVRQKVEKAGLKTYAQVAQTSEGKRHRVRVGPFATRAEAEKAASKIKSLDLPAAILTL
jgi:DedD protein